MTTPYRAAVVGCGRVGFLLERDALRVRPCTHAGGLAAHPDFRLVAGCDIDPGRLSDFGRTYTIAPEHLYSRVEDLLSRERPDVLSIATWTQSHDVIVRLACRAGVAAIICEKPMAVNWARARAMHSAARRAGTLLVINHGRRWTSEYRAVRQFVREKRYGELKHIQGCVLTPFSPSAKRPKTDWHSQIQTAGGGPLLHDGTHLIDIVYYLTGRRPAEIEASLDRPRGSAVERRAWGRIRFRGNPPLDFCFEAGGARKYFHFEVELWFESGRVVVGNGIRTAECSSPSRRYSGFQDLTPDDAFPWPPSAGSVERVCLAEISRWLTDGGAPCPVNNHVDDALLSQESIFAAYESAVRRRPVRFPYRSRLSHPLLRRASS
ncbi:Gfo/Idh/MocA family oxidoreductase [bacterium]|nr:Gfo/Idh/MocA family oxidoreductase [bacterium]